MEDKVQFKAYTYWKDEAKPEVRRFGIEKSVVTSFCYLDAKLQEVYPGLKNKKYTVSWKDEEGDDVSISSDEEVIIALSSMTENLMKLNVYCMNNEPKEIDCDVVITASTEEVPGDNNMPHYGVVCDICDAPVVGFRYKCTSCADYDLCAKCESAGHHADHIMVRVPMPNMPRTTIRAAIRRSRHIMKAVSNSMPDTECPYKRQRRDRSSDKKRHHGHGEGSRGDQHHRRSRSSWLETFTTYMNEFANLAGDIVLETDQNKDKEPQSAQADSKAQSTTNENVQPSKQPEPTTSTQGANQCPFSSDNNDVNVQEIIKMMDTIGLKGILSKLAEKKKPSNASGEVNNDNHDQVMEEDNESVQSGVSSTSKDVQNSKKDASPDRVADDWTVINKEKDLMETDVIKPSAPNEENLPIGFKPTEELQQPIKNGVDNQSLYPQLHVASAVLNPKEPEASTPSQGPTKPKEQVKQKISSTSHSQAKPESQETQPQVYHVVPHIDAAIKQMLSMGFTNDGGWLTQLLESTNGNIAAMLELLTPVNPKK
ncbi:protein ref(2)P-like [Battus philenor]|uniref:protein ref(2)P-like n=1 Tax=Battus philenor TaxID=42288 RepID=UPI0035D12F43